MIWRAEEAEGRALLALLSAITDTFHQLWPLSQSVEKIK
jgi:hypothetical protein